MDDLSSVNAGLGGESCPTPQTMASYIEGKAGIMERNILEAHLKQCSDCRAWHAMTVKMLEQNGLPKRASL